MKHKYNLVLVPTSKNSEITAIARQFSQYADQYLLGNQALPHVTLCQFEATQDQLDTIWARALAMISTKEISLRFAGTSMLELNNFHWVSLIPDHSEELHALHNTAREALEINHAVRFDPHMTLFNSTNGNYRESVEKFSSEYTRSNNIIADDFILALGKSGFAGQFKEIIFAHNPSPSLIKTNRK